MIRRQIKFLQNLPLKEFFAPQLGRSSRLSQGAKYIAVVAICATLSACGGKSVRPQTIPIPEIPPVLTQTNQGAGAAVSIDSLVDKRPSAALAYDEGREIPPSGDLIGTVRKGLEQSLIGHGFSVTDSAPLVISAEVREWRADIERNYNTKIDAKAGVFIQVFDPANKLIYSGLYRGSANFQRGTLKGGEVEETLATAMSESLGQVVKDAQLIKLLSSF